LQLKKQKESGVKVPASYMDFNAEDMVKELT